MKRLILLLCALLISNLAMAKISDEQTQSLILKTTQEINCATNSADLYRTYCALALLKDSQATSLPTQSLLGLSFELPHGATLLKSIDTLHLTVLHTTPSTARLTTLKPSNASEKEMLTKVHAYLAFLFKGRIADRKIPISSDLKAYLEGEAKKPGYPVTFENNRGIYTGKLPATLFKVNDPRSGDTYVIIEEASTGLIVNLFPLSEMVTETK